MAINASFAAVPLLAEAQISTANTNRDGTGTIVTVWDGAACSGGVRIERVLAKALSTTTAGLVRLYVRTSSAGTWRLLDELSVSAVTPSGTTATDSVEYAPSNGLSLPAGAQLGAAPHNAETFNVIAFGGKL